MMGEFVVSFARETADYTYSKLRPWVSKISHILSSRYRLLHNRLVIPKWISSVSFGEEMPMFASNHTQHGTENRLITVCDHCEAVQ